MLLSSSFEDVVDWYWRCWFSGSWPPSAVDSRSYCSRLAGPAWPLPSGWIHREALFRGRRMECQHDRCEKKKMTWWTFDGVSDPDRFVPLFTHVRMGGKSYK